MLFPLPVIMSIAQCWIRLCLYHVHSNDGYAFVLSGNPLHNNIVRRIAIEGKRVLYIIRYVFALYGNTPHCAEYAFALCGNPSHSDGTLWPLWQSPAQ